MSVSGLSSVEASGCLFVGNSATDRAGAVWSSQNTQLTLTRSTTLIDNTALGVGGGGALYIVSTPTIVSNGTRFVGNRALSGGGGAIFWVPSPSTSSSVSGAPVLMEGSSSWTSNRALYGDSLATPALRLVPQNITGLTAGNLTTGAPISPPVTLLLVDAYNQTVVLVVFVWFVPRANTLFAPLRWQPISQRLVQ
jgi:hypothetical protein